MVQAPKLDGNNKKRIALGALALFLFLIGLALVMQGLIDTRNFRDEITRIIEAQTNRKVVIKGNVAVSLLPVPTLYVPSVELRDVPGVEDFSPSATVEMIQIEVSLLSLIKQHPEITNITFEKPVLEVVRNYDNTIKWGWVNADLLKAMAGGDVSETSMAVEIINGKIIYRDSRTEEIIRVNDVNLSAYNSNRLNVEGSFLAYGHSMGFALATDSVSEAEQEERPFSFQMKSDDDSALSIEGKLTFRDDMPIIKGKLDMVIEDVIHWVTPRTGSQDSVLDMVTNRMENNTRKKVTFPLKISGDWSQAGLTAKLDNVVLEGVHSAGSGRMSLSWNDWRPTINVDMHFSAMEYFAWEYLFRVALADTNADLLRKAYRARDGGYDNPIPEDVIFNLRLKADEVYVGQQSWKDAMLSAAVGDGSITVNQFNIELPGDSSLTMFGVISPSATYDLRFEGSMETKGASLRNMLTVLDPSATELPETGFGDFFAKSNIFISSEQLRLSEADVKLGGLRLNGGMVFYFDEQPRVEADVSLKNINFDYFRDAWREQESKNIDREKDFFLKYDKSTGFNWLRRLGATIDFRVKVNRFVFFEHAGTRASFRIYARQGDFGIYDINFIYPTDVMRGTFRLNVMGAKPLVNLSFSASELNTDYFSYDNGFALEETSLKLLPEKAAEIEKTLGAPEDDDDAEDTEIAEEEAVKEDTLKTASGSTVSDYVPSDPEQPMKKATTIETERAPNKALKALGVMKEPDTAQDIRNLLPLDTLKTPDPNVEVVPQVQRRIIRREDSLGEDVIQPPRPMKTFDDLLEPATPRIASVIGSEQLTELIDMSWMSGASGVIDLNVNKLVHGDVTLNNFRLQANFADELLNFKTLTFNYWGGQFSIAGSMYGGKVPGFAVSVAFLNGDFSQIMNDIANRNNITGGVSVSATLSTSGVNYLSWLQQAEGKVVIAVRGMQVQGFNLDGVVNSVNISRTSSDVANSVERSIGNGVTTFSLDGNVNIHNGIFRTPGMNLRSGTVAGTLTGELRVMKWYMDLNSIFQFPQMSSDTIPTLTVQLTGPLEDGEMRVDTSSLEAYVAKRIISK